MLALTSNKNLSDDLPPKPPIPTQVVSNGEYIPMPKTRQQRQVDAVLAGYADQCGGKRGLTRRSFFRTASGMAAAMLAINKVFGDRFFDVQEVEAADEAAASTLHTARVGLNAGRIIARSQAAAGRTTEEIGACTD